MTLVYNSVIDHHIYNFIVINTYYVWLKGKRSGINHDKVKLHLQYVQRSRDPSLIANLFKANSSAHDLLSKEDLKVLKSLDPQ